LPLRSPTAAKESRTFETSHVAAHNRLKLSGEGSKLWAFIATELLLMDKARTVNLSKFHRCGKLPVPAGVLS